MDRRNEADKFGQLLGFLLLLLLVFLLLFLHGSCYLPFDLLFPWIILAI